MTVSETKAQGLAGLILCVALGALGCGGTDDAAALAARPRADLVVDTAKSAGVRNAKLNGVHEFSPPEYLDYQIDVPGQLRSMNDAAPLGVIRSVTTRLQFDCATGALDPTLVAEYQDWVDLVFSLGARPMLSLNMVPRCVTADGGDRSRVVDPASYDRFLDAFLDAFVTERKAAGKQPVTLIEGWNEPSTSWNLSDSLADSIAHYVSDVWIPLGHAVQRAEERSGVDIELGGPADVSGSQVREWAPDTASLVKLLWPELSPSGTEKVIHLLDQFSGLFERYLAAGGTSYPDAVVAAAKSEGFAMEFMSWHTYLNSPFNQSWSDPEHKPPPSFDPDNPTLEALLSHRINPHANPQMWIDEAARFRQRYPGLALYLTEWNWIGTGDERLRNYNAAALRAAGLVALQQAGIDAALVLTAVDDSHDAWWTHRMFGSLPTALVEVSAAVPSAESGLWAMAGVAGDDVGVSFALWNAFEESVTPRTVTFELRGLRADTEYGVEARLVDVAHRGQAEPTSTQVVVSDGDGNGVVAIDLVGLTAGSLSVTPRPPRRTSSVSPRGAGHTEHLLTSRENRPTSATLGRGGLSGMGP